MGSKIKIMQSAKHAFKLVKFSIGVGSPLYVLVNLVVGVLSCEDV